MRIKWLGPGMMLDQRGTLWVDSYARGVEPVIGGKDCSAVERDGILQIIVKNLEPFGVKRARLFDSRLN